MEELIHPKIMAIKQLMKNIKKEEELLIKQKL
jgi:hypothetical protein